MSANFTETKDEVVIDGIRQGGRMRDDYWKQIIRYWGDYCCNTIVRSIGCSRAQAAEGLSMAVVGVDRRIRSSTGYDFLTTATLKTYITASAIYATRKLLHQSERLTEEPAPDIPAAEADGLLWFKEENCREILEKSLENISPTGRKVLTMFNDGYSMKEIAAAVGYSNEEIARKEKYKYQEKFKKYLADHPHIIYLLKENCYE